MQDFLDVVEFAATTIPHLAWLRHVVCEETNLDKHLAEGVATALQGLRNWAHTTEPSYFLEVELPGILARDGIEPAAIGRAVHPSAIQTVVAVAARVAEVSAHVLGDTDAEWDGALVSQCWPRLREHLWGIAELHQFPKQDQVQTLSVRLRQELSLGVADLRERGVTSTETENPTSPTPNFLESWRKWALGNRCLVIAFVAFMGLSALVALLESSLQMFKSLFEWIGR